MIGSACVSWSMCEISQIVWWDVGCEVWRCDLNTIKLTPTKYCQNQWHNTRSMVWPCSISFVLREPWKHCLIMCYSVYMELIKHWGLQHHGNVNNYDSFSSVNDVSTAKTSASGTQPHKHIQEKTPCHTIYGIWKS